MTQAQRREDYRPPDYRIEHLELTFRLGETTTVEAVMQVRRAPGVPATAPLVLDGRELELLELRIDGAELPAGSYALEPQHLRIAQVPDRFCLQTRVRIRPEDNSSLEGLYRSGPMLCTQCEAHGFSRITYFLDRPDVLAPYRVRIEADADRYPVLLSNGDCIEQGLLEGGRHFAVWQDPHPKPCYLFALVAGRLAEVRDQYITASGREVQLRFFVDPGNEDRVAHAIASLKAAMRWDETVYGLEYDLDTYMVVAARDFNMGAMENKGLNLFNAAYVLASPDTATDEDYDHVEAVIGHEYFHNWTGNRVTCRDWFQLSLKEGLTVFREQQFSAAMGGTAARRIADVRMLRARQFPEDAGPMAHPVRPESYIEVNNFYTATIYEKGAELIRMIETIVGPETFIAGVREYLRRHDGQAATIEDFLRAHEEVSGRSLDGFRRWYSQAGTPVVSVEDEYEARTGRYRLRLRQHTPPTPGQPRKAPLPIPVRFALMDEEGGLLPIPESAGLARPGLVLLEEEERELVVEGLASAPVPQFLHGFSAPVRLRYPWRPEQQLRLLLRAEDAFVRWEAAQGLMQASFEEGLAGVRGDATRALLDGLQRLAARPPEDRSLLSELLRLPSSAYLLDQMSPAAPLRVAEVRTRLRSEVASALTGPLSVWAEWAPEDRTSEAAARRRLGNLALAYLTAIASERVLELCRRRVWHGRNMTLVQGALAALNQTDSPQRDAAMAHFLSQWRHDPLVLDKWFALEASCEHGDIRARIERLLRHPDFDARNPNRVRAVLGSFTRENLRGFHAENGSGYQLVAEWVARLDRSNPQLAARLVDVLLDWRRFTEPHQSRLRAVLEGLQGEVRSPDVREKLHHALQT